MRFDVAMQRNFHKSVSYFYWGLNFGVFFLEREIGRFENRKVMHKLKKSEFKQRLKNIYFFSKFIH